MAKIKDPLQFSAYYGVSQAKLNMLGVFDPTLNVDAKLFIDPLLLSSSEHQEMREAENTYKAFFAEIIKLLEASQKENDIAWRAAAGKMRFKEIKGTCLGYGAASIQGSGFGPHLTQRITATAKEIIDLGVKDPDLFIALPLLEGNIGPDLISDMTTNIILPDILRFNQKIFHKIKIPLERFELKGYSAQLPVNPIFIKKTPVILVPKDILRELPLANDWDEVCDAAAHNSLLRAKVNKLIGNIWSAKKRKDKEKIKMRALASASAFNTLLETIHDINAGPYNMEQDPEGILVWRRIHEEVAKKYPLKISAPKKHTVDSLYAVVVKIIDQFKHLVEHRGLSKELWHNGERRGEKSVQRILFAVADSYCKANNLDINPEVDTGSGLIDFKFSAGYDARVIVEVKLSDNKNLISGYSKQLEKYKEAEKTAKGLYVVIDIGYMKKKTKDLFNVRNEFLGKKQPASELVFIDGMIRPTASKLK